ncbi:antitoxin Xre/MbcA/ParS toxin-binding domain-containing protein [Colwelliaceae bacterium 6441]
MKSEQLLNDLLADQVEIKMTLLGLFKQHRLALKWLLTPKSQLSGDAPVDRLESEPEAVEDLLNRIQRGDLS